MDVFAGHADATRMAVSASAIRARGGDTDSPVKGEEEGGGGRRCLLVFPCEIIKRDHCGD